MIVEGGAEIQANTFNIRKGGNIIINASELVTLKGTLASGRLSSAIAANALLRVITSELLIRERAEIAARGTQNSSGNSGNIFIKQAQTAIIEESGKISVEHQGTGEAGRIELESDSITLDHDSLISAETTSNTGGNINLQIEDLLLMTNNSNISATAGTAGIAGEGGDGGNITINTDFIIAFPDENSDITANAFTGNGGRISITAKGIFGIELRDRLTPLSDITASSTFGLAGIVDINNPDVDPNQGLAKLQETPEEVELAEGCQADDGQETVAFFNIGGGGLPPTPEEPFRSEIIIAPWFPPISALEEDSDQVFSGSFSASGNRGSRFRRIPCRNNSVSEPLN